MEELVFAVPADSLWKTLTYKATGLIRGSNEILDRIIGKGLFRRRSDLETDTSFKQLIPYGLISYMEPGIKVGESCSYLLFQRSSGQAEKRLQNKLYLGAGGHMNPGKINESNVQYAVSELKREIFEEIKFLNGCSILDIEFIGFINDDTIPVGKVHLGLLYDVRISGSDVITNEPGKMTAKWVDKASLSEYYHEMETWSGIVVDYYIK